MAYSLTVSEQIHLSEHTLARFGTWVFGYWRSYCSCMFPWMCSYMCVHYGWTLCRDILYIAIGEIFQGLKISRINEFSCNKVPWFILCTWTYSHCYSSIASCIDHDVAARWLATSFSNFFSVFKLFFRCSSSPHNISMSYRQHVQYSY